MARDYRDYSGANFGDWYNQVFNRSIGKQFSREKVSNQVAVDSLLPIGYASANIAPGAYQNLANIIASQGKTDPAAMNRDITDIARKSQIAEQDLVGQDAALGYGGGSGVFKAIQAAIGQGGREQIAGRKAQETQMAEQRKRADLELFLQVLTNPALAASGLGQQTPQGPGKSEQFLQILSLLAAAA